MIKNVKGFEGIYGVSFDGRIFNLNTGKEKCPVLDKATGYYKVQLWKNNKMKCFFIHRILASAFMPPEEGKYYVNHKNGVKTDNKIENLEWCTNKENSIHSIEVLGNSVFDKAPNFKGVIHKVYGVFLTAQEAAKMLGISKKGMLKMLNGEKKNTSFFEWSV